MILTIGLVRDIVQLYNPLPNFVFIRQTVLPLECSQTDRQTDNITLYTIKMVVHNEHDKSSCAPPNKYTSVHPHTRLTTSYCAPSQW